MYPTAQPIPRPRLLTGTLAAGFALLSTLSAAPARAQTAGPDAFGYTAGPTAYDFERLSINPAATALGMGNDDEQLVSLPFAFPFYGRTSSTLMVGANGALEVSSTLRSISFFNSCASSSAPDIAVFWDDLAYGSSSDVYTWHDVTAGRFIVSREGVGQGNTTGDAVF